MLTSNRLDFLPCLTVQRNPLNRPMRTRMSGGVAGESGRPLPLCRFSRIPGLGLWLEVAASLMRSGFVAAEDAELAGSIAHFG